MDVRDFSEGPPNNQRPPKPPRKTKVMLQNLIPPPGCPDYMAMNAHHYGHSKTSAYRSQRNHPRKEKGAYWMACLSEEVAPLKVVFHNSDIYWKRTDSSKNHHEEPQEKKTQEEHGPKEKNMRVFYKLNVKENINITATPLHEEEYDEQNYESVEECKTTL